MHTQQHDEHIFAFAVEDSSITEDELRQQLLSCPECIASAYDLMDEMHRVVLAGHREEVVSTLHDLRLNRLVESVMEEMGRRDADARERPTQAKIIAFPARKLVVSLAIAAALIATVGISYRMIRPDKPQGAWVVAERTVRVVENVHLGEPPIQDVDESSIVKASVDDTIQIETSISVATMETPHIVILVTEATDKPRIYRATVSAKASQVLASGKPWSEPLLPDGGGASVDASLAFTKSNLTLSAPCSWLRTGPGSVVVQVLTSSAFLSTDALGQLTTGEISQKSIDYTVHAAQPVTVELSPSR